MAVAQNVIGGSSSPYSHGSLNDVIGEPWIRPASSTNYANSSTSIVCTASPPTCTQSPSVMGATYPMTSPA